MSRVKINMSDIEKVMLLLQQSMDQNKILMEQSSKLLTENESFKTFINKNLLNQTSNVLVQQVMGPVKFSSTFKTFTELNCAMEKFELWRQTFLSTLPSTLHVILTNDALSGNDAHDKLLLDAIILGFGERIIDYSNKETRSDPIKIWKQINDKFNPTSEAAYAKYQIKYNAFTMDNKTDPEVLFNRLNRIREQLVSCGDVITPRAYREKMFQTLLPYYPRQVDTIKNIIALKVDETGKTEEEIHILMMIRRLSAIVQANFDAQDNITPKAHKVTTETISVCPTCNKNHGTNACWVKLGVKCENCGGVHPTKFCRKVKPEMVAPVPGATHIPQTMAVTRIAMMARTLHSTMNNDGTLVIDPLAFNISAPSNRMFVDSGCTDGMTNNRQLFHQFQSQLPTNANGAGGDLAILGSGTVLYNVSVHYTGQEQMVEASTKMLYVPKLSINLFSVKQATANGCKVTFYPHQKFTEKKCAGYIKLNNGMKVVLHIDSRVGLYYFDIQPTTTAMLTTVNIEVKVDSEQGTKKITKNKSTKFESQEVLKNTDEDVNVFNRRLGYVDSRVLDRISKIHNYSLAGQLESNPSLVSITNIKKQSIPRNPISNNYIPLQEFVIDTGGPYHPKSSNGDSYAYLGICRSTRMSFIGFGKDITGNSMTNWLKHLQVNEFPIFFKDCKLGTVLSDCHGGFDSKVFGDLLLDSKIAHRFTTPHTAESRGVVEQSITQNLNKSITLMNQAQLYGPYRTVWNHAMVHSNTIRRLLPSRYIKDNVSPLVRSNNAQYAARILKHIKMFGSLAVLHQEKLLRTKFDDRGQRAIYLGMELNKFCFETGVFINLEKNTYPIYSRHFHVFEGQTIFDSIKADPTLAPQASQLIQDSKSEDNEVDTFNTQHNLDYLSAVVEASLLRYDNRIRIDNVNIVDPVVNNDQRNIDNDDLLFPGNNVRYEPLGVLQADNMDSNQQTPLTSHNNSMLDNNNSNFSDGHESDLSLESVIESRGHRDRDQHHINYADYHSDDSDIINYTDNDDSDYDPSAMAIYNVYGAHSDNAIAAFNISKSDIKPPGNLKELELHKYKEQFKASDYKEHYALIANKTWIEVYAPKDAIVLNTTLLRTVKADIYGELTTKSRYIVLDEKKKSPVPETNIITKDAENYSPVVSYVLLRIVLVLAAYLRLDVDHYDFSTAFLNAPCPFDIYIKPYPGWAPKGIVYKLKKMLYGLQGAPKQWYLMLLKWLTTEGFQSSESEKCFMFKIEPGSEKLWIIVVFYVDEFISTGTWISERARIKTKLFADFKMSDLGKIGSQVTCIGYEILYTSDGLLLHQHNYVMNLLQFYSMESCYPVVIPAKPGKNNFFEAVIDESLRDKIIKFVGKMWFLVRVSRFDCLNATRELANNVHRPSVILWEACMYLMRYLKGTPYMGLFYPYGTSEATINDLKILVSDPHFQLHASSDASFNSDTGTSKSITGMKICLGKATILVSSKLQSTLAMNTTAAEYAAASDTVNELMHIKAILEPLFKINYPIKLTMDNTAAIRIGYNAFGTKNGKYITLRYHNVRNSVLDGDIILVFHKTHNFDVDMFTKNEPKVTFITNRNSICGITYEYILYLLECAQGTLAKEHFI